MKPPKVVILAAGTGSRLSMWKSEQPKPLMRLCGLPLIERTIRTCQRAGFEEFVIVTGYRADDIQSRVKDGSQFGVRIEYAANPDWKMSNGISVLKAEKFVEDEFVLMMSDHIVDVETMKRLHRTNLGSDDLVLVTDQRTSEVFDIDDATKVQLNGDRIESIGKELPTFNAIDTGIFLCSSTLFEVLKEVQAKKGDASLSDGVRILSEKGTARGEDIGQGWWQDVDAYPAYKHAEKMLLQSMRKPTDVWVAKTFNRPISLFFTKYLCRTSVRPDVVSFVSMLIGFFSPVFLVQGEYWSFALGAFFYHFSSVMDGCDGELARIKFNESPKGEWVDTIADVITHYLFASGAMIGLYVSTGYHQFLFIGAMAMVGMTALLYIMFQYIAKVAKRGSLIAFDQDYSKSVKGIRDVPTMLAKWTKPLVRRATFAFIFFLLALMGRIDVALTLMAIATNVAFVLVYVTFRRKQRAVALESAQ